MERLTRWSLFFLVATFLCACAGWTPEQTTNVMDAIDAMQKNGTLTVEQAEAMRQWARGMADGISWSDVLNKTLEIGAGVAGVLLTMLGGKKVLPFLTKKKAE